MAAPSPLLHSPASARVLPPETMLPALRCLADWELRLHSMARKKHEIDEGGPDLVQVPDFEQTDGRRLREVPRRERLSYEEFW